MNAADIVAQFQGDARGIADELAAARARLEEERRVMTRRAEKIAEDVSKVDALRHKELMGAQDEVKQLRNRLDRVAEVNRVERAAWEGEVQRRAVDLEHREAGIERLITKYGPLGEGMVPLAEVYELLGIQDSE